MMQNELPVNRTLAQIEEEVLAEGREWTRQRLQLRLQEEAERIGRSFSPPGKTLGALSKKNAHAAKQRRPR
jgi:hypothetical protein